MKNKLYITVALLGSLLLASCDSFLDIQPVGKVIPNTLAEYRALFTTVYNTKLMDKAVAELRTDIGLIETQNSTSMNTYGDIATWNDLSPKAGTREFTWDKYYSNIYYSNAIISKQNEITEGSPEEIRQLVGEAYLMRAYMHFILVNLYGQPYTQEGALNSKAVPVKWDMDLEAVPVRNTVKEVYEAILSDIQSAQKNMNKKEWEEKFRYRFSTLTADALEARVHLYMGQWDKAYNAAERVLAAQAALEDLNAKDAKLPNDFQSKETINAYELFNDDVTSAMEIAPAFLKKYDAENDLRFARYFKVRDDKKAGNDKENAPKAYLSIKSGKSQYSCSFRTGEMYLTAAEAAAQLNKLPEARKRLCDLMEKRYRPESFAAKKGAVEKMDASHLLNEILEERARELAVEGHRWFDLRRTTRPRIEKEIKGKTYVIEQNDVRYTLRIPQSAIDANPGLLN